MANTIPGLNVVVSGYPNYFGKNKYRQMADHYGPLAYSNVATSSGTGDIVNASDFGFGGIDDARVAFGGFSASGNYYARFTIPGADSNALGSAQAKVSLQWFVVSPAFGTIGVEVTNGVDLTAEVVRIEMVMV